MSVYYEPTPENKEYLLNFLVSLSHLYPCKLCAMHMRVFMKQNPPKLNSREEFAIWLSQFHNDVSKYIGNKEYPENYDWILKRWKTGFDYCHNHNNDELSAEESVECEDVSMMDLAKNIIKAKIN